jgi:predicted TIM-barrel fold metal-dependent hydrolase
MSNRREFLRRLPVAAAGIFAGCAFPDSARAFQNQPPSGAPGAKRREVTIGGRRVTTYDLHCHFGVNDVWNVIPKDQPVPDYLEDQARTFRNHPPSPFDPRGPEVQRRLADMDEMGVDVDVISNNAVYYWMDEDLARKHVTIQNQKSAELCAAWPDRFVGLGSVALQHPALAVEQLEEGVKKFGMRGFDIGGSVNGEEISAPKFHPFWAKAEQLGTLIFIHPWGFGGMGDLMPGQPRLGGNGQLGNVIGNPLETTVALSHLIQDGVLDKYPNLKILAAHGGGFLPSYAGRSDQCLTQFPAACKPLKKKPTEYLKQLYYDSMVFTNEGLRHLIAEVGIGQIVLGTDYPTRWARDGVDRILSASTLSDADRIAILNGNARRLLKL